MGWNMSSTHRSVTLDAVGWALSKVAVSTIDRLLVALGIDDANGCDETCREGFKELTKVPEVLVGPGSLLV